MKCVAAEQQHETASANDGFHRRRTRPTADGLVTTRMGGLKDEKGFASNGIHRKFNLFDSSNSILKRFRIGRCCTHEEQKRPRNENQGRPQGCGWQRQNGSAEERDEGQQELRSALGCGDAQRDERVHRRVFGLQKINPILVREGH